MIRRAGLVWFAALVGALVIGCGGGGQARRLEESCGLECAADELRYRLASAPRDRELYVALAEIEEKRGRPGAAIEALEAAERLGRAFRGGLGGADRARLGRLLAARGRSRAGQGRAGADADLVRARALGADVPGELARDAARIAIVHDLRHTDPERRARGVKRLQKIDPERAAALAGEGAPLAIARTAAWLDEARAYRVMREMLDEVVRVRGVAALAEMPGAADRWLAARRWWRGVDGRPDLVTLERAVAAGASPCWYPRAHERDACPPPGPRAGVLDDHGADRGDHGADRGDHGADRGDHGADRGDHGADRGDRGADRGDRGADRGDRAADRGDRGADRGDHGGDGGDAAGARPGGDDVAGLGIEVDGQPWAAVAARLVFAAGDEPAPVPLDDLSAVAAAYVSDPALADRRAEDAIARHVDVAAAAPAIARLFSLLGDPARARRLWQRAFEASDEDAELALGLAVAMAEAGDPAAGMQMMTRAAAAWGDARAAMLHGARAFAAAGHTVEALTLVKAALGLSAPGDEEPAAALAAALLDELGRTADAAQLRALAPAPGAWDGTDARAAVDAEVRAAGEPTTRRAALARLARLATSADPSVARLAAAALRAQLVARPAPP